MPELLRILQIEDSESDAELIARRIAGGGYEVLARRVESGEAMRDAMREGPWDVIVSDYSLPGFDASAALELLKSTGQDIPFIVVSGAIGEETAVAMMRAGAHDCVSKDNLLRLLPAVEREIREARARALRRQAEADLAESQERLALTIEASELGTFDFFPGTGRVVYAGAIRAHLGLPGSAEDTYEAFLEVVHPADRDRVDESVQKAMRAQTGGVYNEVYRSIGGGREHWVSASGRVFFDSDGVPSRFLGTTRDITQGKQAEEAAQFQMYLTHCITQQSADAICVTDNNGQIHFMNSETERLFGFSSEDWKNGSAHDLVHHHYEDGRPYPASECSIARYIAQGKTLRDHEDLYFHKNGTPIPVSISVTPLRMGDAPIGMVLTVRDISGRKRAERVLRESEQRLRRLIEADVVGIAIGDADTIQYANDYFLNLIQYSRIDLSSGTVAWPGALREALPRFRGAGACPAFETEYPRRDGTRAPVLLGGVTTLQDPFQIMIFAVDLTERRNLESQIRQSQKMESIGMLAGSVAHDFNHLITIILGYATQASQAITSAHPLHDPLRGISIAAGRALELTSKLLTFGRRAPGMPEPIVLNDLVRSTNRILEILIGENISTALALNADPSFILADVGHIDQVIMNLALNARDSMPRGGRMYIETSRMTVDDDFAATCLSVPRGDYVMLSVSDTGCGMPPDVQARVFEPFFTTKENGSGLGLSTVYGIVKQAGGTITVHSSPGVGSTFRVLFPSVEAPETGRTAEPRIGTETILLVEDEDAVRKYVLALLSRHGYTVLDAANGRDAIELARRYRSPIHLLLTDTVLPGMGGAETAHEIESLRPGIPVVRMSGYAEHTKASEFFIQKPFAPEALLGGIRAALDATALKRNLP